MFTHRHLTAIIITIFIFISIYIPTSRSHNCTNLFHCGENVQGIGYPFYGQDRPAACGLAGFELKCQDNENITTIEISSQTFRVLRIDQYVHTITLARSDLLDDVCPQRFNSTITMDDILFSYVRGTVQFLNLYYSCPFGVGQTPDRNRLTCSIGGRDRNGCYLNESSWSINELRSCDVNVTVPVLRMAVDEFMQESGDYNISLKGLLEEGFPVEYKFDVEACAACERSSGLCWSGTNTTAPSCVCEGDQEIEARACTTKSGSGSSNFTFRLKIMLGGVALMVGLGIVLIIYCYFRMPSFGKYLAFFGLRPKNGGNDDEAFMTQYRFSTPRRYKYSEIKSMTNAFKDELGQGGFGSVFKGTLPDGSLVAVKVLKVSKGNGEEFFNEVASISRTSHVNIVALKGFCYEGPKKFMPNGSLERFIFQNIPKDSEHYPGVEKLYEIALGIARGLEYLHRGCNTRILHFDIKPHNILLDDQFCPKISDFGLAKLHSSKESIMSIVEARGTIGYIAPEVYNRNFGGVSHKSDVYSYGMMVVEMVGGRKNLDVGVVHSSEIYFPQWIYKRLEQDKDLQLLQQGPTTTAENEIAKKMIIVGLWCIQAHPSQRPSMNKVIDMLVGSTEALTIPPNPFFSSPPRPQGSSSTTLDTITQDGILPIVG